MSLYFETCPLRTRRKYRPALATIILAVGLAIILAKIIADPANPCLSSFRKNIRLLNTHRTDHDSAPATYRQSGEHFNT
jgi:hypothetical protein